MTRLISIDASTEACSVALLNDKEVTEQYQLAPREHARLLLPMVDTLLSDAALSLNQLDAIVCNVGPGAFTGIRIAVSVAQGLAFGADLPVIPVSSLANLAQQAFADQTISSNVCWSAIDARMQEVYFAVYQRDQQGLAKLSGEEQVIAPALINFSEINQKQHANQRVTMGSGWSAYCGQFNINQADLPPLLANGYPKASASLVLAKKYYAEGLLLQPEALQPVYLRNNVAKKKTTK